MPITSTKIILLREPNAFGLVGSWLNAAKPVASPGPDIQGCRASILTLSVMKTTNQNIDFSKSVKVSVDIQDLANLGWELSDELESKETYHVDIVVNDEGKTKWNLTNTQKEQGGIWEGSDSEETGDDEQTIKDLEKLHSEGNLFNIITEYYGA